MKSKVEIKLEKPQRGGYRPASKLSKGTQRLLKVLWEKHGGPRALERETGIAAQKFIHWRNKGKVSLKMAGELARKLNVPVEALNYEDMLQLLGSIADWETVYCRYVELSYEEKCYVQKGKSPKQTL